MEKDSIANQMIEASFSGIAQGGIIGIGFDCLLTEDFSIGFNSRLDFIATSQEYDIRNYSENYTQLHRYQAWFKISINRKP